MNRHEEAVGANLRLADLPFDRSLPVDRPVTVRPIFTGTGRLKSRPVPSMAGAVPKNPGTLSDSPQNERKLCLNTLAG